MPNFDSLPSILADLSGTSWTTTANSTDFETVLDAFDDPETPFKELVPGYNTRRVAHYDRFAIEFDTRSRTRLRVTDRSVSAGPTTTIASTGQSIATIPASIASQLSLDADTVLGMSLSPSLGTFTFTFSTDCDGVFCRDVYETYQAQHDYYQYKLCFPSQLIHALQLHGSVLEWHAPDAQTLLCQPACPYPQHSLLPPQSEFTGTYDAQIVRGKSADTDTGEYSEYQLYIPANLCRKANIVSRDTVAVYLFPNGDSWMLAVTKSTDTPGSHNNRRVFGDDSYDGVHFKFPKHIGRILEHSVSTSRPHVSWTTDNNNVLFGRVAPNTAETE